ncbi:phosphofurin acidic cluster sorting protein 1 isoform X2 [Aethina tumida]|uniref:phosphofurin acidic cluster sorting protein 1 isoform X2 n=1 Tax=Aethina tumida TaxID=116153 RepID=UPI0021495E7B|nr:phosphofurin acidic cluster sorting protein 1 isoform X2 [Aethina tumida]
MSEKPSKTLSGAGASAPNKMRLYATGVDRTPSNCIPRLCSLTLTRIILLRPLGSDLASISIAVKMQSSKRTLRSHELNLPQGGLLDTPLDMTFCLQYPHFLKREGNKLHVLLQRRKRYKNRTMLGFKTLAEGIIRMDQILQKQMDLELELMAESGKEKGANPVARVTVLQLSSTPIDHEHKTERDHDFSDDDDDISSGEEEPGDLSDSEPIRTKMPHARHNLKQRFVSLLRRFRVADSEGGRGADLDNPSDIQALFQELESLSCDEDSGNEQDTMSISSTPKPSLRPFFSSSRSLLDSNPPPCVENDRVGDDRTCSGSDGNADVCYTDPEGQSDPQTGSPPREQSVGTRKIAGDSEFANIMQELSERKSKLFRSGASSAKKKNSLSVGSDAPPPESITVRKVFADQILKLLPLEETMLPECVVLLSGPENVTGPLQTRLASLPNLKVFVPLSAIETKTVLTALFTKIHNCNSCAKPGAYVKILLIGGDTLIGWSIRPYVETLSSKSSEWLAYSRLYIVPMGTCNMARHLATLDQGYATLFPNDQELKLDDLCLRINRYLSVSASAPIAQLPLGEAMLTCYDENSQLFIPFVNDVRVGPADHTLSVSVDLEDTCSSPPAPSLTPPSSPNVQARESPWEPLELQLDYWQIPKFNEMTTLPVVKTDKTQKQDGKTSLKALFRGIHATPTSTSGLNLNINLASKEKKQKIMRLGKKKEKEKDTEPRNHAVEGVSRLICSARASHTAPMKVYIDGVDFNGVKFFQLSSTWQTHVKNVSVALVGVPLASMELN